MLQDAVAIVPEEYSVEILDKSSNQGKSDSMHKTYLDFMNLEIAMAILGNNLTTEVQGGSQAAATVHMSVRDDIVESDANICEQVFNELIKIS